MFFQPFIHDQIRQCTRRPAVFFGTQLEKLVFFVLQPDDGGVIACHGYLLPLKIKKTRVLLSVLSTPSTNTQVKLMNNEQLVKLPPVAVCSVCSKYTHRIELANEQCYERHAKNRCKGVYQSAISVGDWATCPSCHSVGCEACQRSGFVFVRKR